MTAGPFPMRPGESFDSNATFLRNPILRVKIMKNLLEQKIWRVATYSACAALFVSILLLLGCGGGTSSSSPNPLPNTTALQVNLGDAPSDRLVAVSMTIGSMTLTNGSGSSVTVVSSSTPVEMMHLMGTVEPISLPASTFPRPWFCTWTRLRCSWHRNPFPGP